MILAMMVKQTVGLPYSQSKQNLKTNEFKEIIQWIVEKVRNYPLYKDIKRKGIYV